MWNLHYRGHSFLKGAAVGRVVVNSPEINFVDGNTEEKSQSGKNENWLSIADQLFPLRIDKLTINKGKLPFTTLIPLRLSILRCTTFILK